MWGTGFSSCARGLENTPWVLLGFCRVLGGEVEKGLEKLTAKHPRLLDSLYKTAHIANCPPHIAAYNSHRHPQASCLPLE